MLEICLKISPLTQLEDEVVGVFGSLIAKEFDNISMLDTIKDCELLIQKLLHVLLFDHVQLDDFNRDWNFH